MLSTPMHAALPNPARITSAPPWNGLAAASLPWNCRLPQADLLDSGPAPYESFGSISRDSPENPAQPLHAAHTVQPCDGKCRGAWSHRDIARRCRTDGHLLPVTNAREARSV